MTSKHLHLETSRLILRPWKETDAASLRYHSWVVDNNDFPECLQITAVSPEGYIMALHHKTMDIQGIQFHPESVLTPDGKQMIRNWLNH